tara:strand:- start:535 stop:1635 length:1101 start_codon:yes stop_codon:yes gene_type:complete
MKWNWEQPEWPTFNFSIDNEKEIEFIKQASLMTGAISVINRDSLKDIEIELISEEALKTSEIEGEYLDRKSIQSSIKKNFGIQTNEKIPEKERGVSNMMIFIYSNYKKKLSHSYLYELHKRVCGHDKNIRPGRYRSGNEPMQIVSGNIGHPKVHFEAPPSSNVKAEMDMYIQWFNDTSPNGKAPLPCLIRASIAHFYFESIHPFEDGNGRIGRALVKKIISEHTETPTLMSLSKVIFENQREYYLQFEKNNRTLNINRWINYFSDTILMAQKHTIKLIQFIVKKSEIRSHPELNKRQTMVLLRIFDEGLGGFKGGLSSENYIKISKTSRATATRDLQHLVELHILKKTGHLKSTRYTLQFLDDLNT